MLIIKASGFRALTSFTCNPITTPPRDLSVHADSNMKIKVQFSSNQSSADRCEPAGY